jgi:hypothetical protein
VLLDSAVLLRYQINRLTGNDSKARYCATPGTCDQHMLDIAVSIHVHMCHRLRHGSALDRITRCTCIVIDPRCLSHCFMRTTELTYHLVAGACR